MSWWKIGYERFSETANHRHRLIVNNLRNAIVICLSPESRQLQTYHCNCILFNVKTVARFCEERRCEERVEEQRLSLSGFSKFPAPHNVCNVAISRIQNMCTVIEMVHTLCGFSTRYARVPHETSLLHNHLQSCVGDPTDPLNSNGRVPARVN